MRLGKGVARDQLTMICGFLTLVVHSSDYSARERYIRHQMDVTFEKNFTHHSFTIDDFGSKVYNHDGDVSVGVTVEKDARWVVV